MTKRRELTSRGLVGTLAGSGKETSNTIQSSKAYSDTRLKLTKYTSEDPAGGRLQQYGNACNTYACKTSISWYSFSCLRLQPTAFRAEENNHFNPEALPFAGRLGACPRLGIP